MRTAAFLLALVLAPASTRAQDSQYWNLQYGPVAELLGGVVVGSTRDLSATFYNPGALALTKNPSLVASVSSFEAAPPPPPWPEQAAVSAIRTRASERRVMRPSFRARERAPAAEAYP